MVEPFWWVGRPRFYTPYNEVVGGMLVSPCPSVCPSACRQILCRTITWVVFLRIFYNFISCLLVKLEDPFHFWRFSLFPFQSYWTWYDGKYDFYSMSYDNLSQVFFRIFWNFISSLPVKRGGSLSCLVGTISNVLVMEIGWTDVGSGWYILVSCSPSNTS